MADTKDDKDRAAILARRQHFIAFALSGLATTAVACDQKTAEPNSTKGNSGPTSAPQPCLDYAVPREEEEGGEQQAEGGAEGDGIPPHACLKIAEPEPDPAADSEGDAQPKPCLEMALPEGEAAPRPCLDVAPESEPIAEEPEPVPRPCLKKRPPDTDPKPPPSKPQPCLRKATPD